MLLALTYDALKVHAPPVPVLVHYLSLAVCGARRPGTWIRLYQDNAYFVS